MHTISKPIHTLSLAGLLGLALVPGPAHAGWVNVTDHDGWFASSYTAGGSATARTNGYAELQAINYRPQSASSARVKFQQTFTVPADATEVKVELDFESVGYLQKLNPGNTAYLKWELHIESADRTSTWSHDEEIVRYEMLVCQFLNSYIPCWDNVDESENEVVYLGEVPPGVYSYTVEVYATAYHSTNSWFNDAVSEAIADFGTRPWTDDGWVDLHYVVVDAFVPEEPPPSTSPTTPAPTPWWCTYPCRI
jgi:hypothetical protein